MKIAHNDLEELSEAKTFPDKTPYRSLSVHHVLELSRRSGLSGRETEIAALENNVVPERYARNIRTFSLVDQGTLLKAHAGVVGLGGLGGTVTEILTRLGVGRLTLMDGDRFEDSNLNRQLLSSIAHLGTPKTEAARKRVHEINPSIDVTVHSRFLNPVNAAELLAGCHVVVDCLDNLRTRFEVEDACRQLGCPRGNARASIFLDDTDRQILLGALEAAVERFGWRIHAYCLMGNHYHLLAETPQPNLSSGMRWLNSVYTQRFNRRHERVGHVLQGRFKAILVERDSYLLELARYFVLNPVRAGLVGAPGAWRWSSYQAMVGAKPAPSWLCRNAILNAFGGGQTGARDRYRHFVAAGIGRDSPACAR